MNSINQAGYINLEFVEVFQAELKRQRQLNAQAEQNAAPSYQSTSAARAEQRLARAAAREALLRSQTTPK